MAKVFHDKIIYENIRSLAIFSRIFSYEFIMRNLDRLGAAFYTNDDNFICVAYKCSPNRNLMIGFHNDEPNGCFIGYYDDDGIPVIEEINHHVFIPFGDGDNAKAIISQKVYTIFGVEINL